MAIINQTLQPSLPPPNRATGAVGWLKKNLFSTPTNSIISIIMLVIIAMLLTPIIRWMIIDADWLGDSREACTSGGACWVFIKVRFAQFMYGFYPDDQYWRVNLAGLILILGIFALVIERFPLKKWIGIFMLFIFPVLAYLLIHGSETLNHWNGSATFTLPLIGDVALPVVETSQWGGLMLTIVIAFVGILTSLPLGILLAMGRRSDMPIIKSVCVVFIEFWRGVPLITVLFMASVMLPLFLPVGTNFDKLLRALIGITLFQSAYIAEVVRGGLQAIPKGQYEAANAMGLTYWQSMRLIILPQALKIVIPGLVNSFISLFKDTSLVMIIGLFDLLSIIQAAFKDANWSGYSIEGYVFAALIYWVFCFSMSRYSQSLERKLDTGHKR